MQPADQTCWRTPRRAWLAFKLFALCSGLSSIGHGLSYTCFRWVCKALLVFSAVEHIILPLELFVATIWFVKANWLLRWLLARLICTLKCILGGAFGFAYGSIVFRVWEHFWSLWLLASLYVGLDCLILPTFVHRYGHVKGHPKVCRHVISVQCISQHGT